jgi:ribonucrease Y
MTSSQLLIVIAVALVAGVFAFVIGRVSKGAAVPESEAEKQRVLSAARGEADAVKRAAAVEAKETAQRVRGEAEAEIRARKQELEKKAAELGARGQALDRQEKELSGERDDIGRKEKQLASREAAAEAAARAAATQAGEAKARLEKVAGLSVTEARKLLEQELRDEVRREVAADLRRIEDDAKNEAADRSRIILAAAVQRYASEYVTERTVSVVPLPSDDMKGRIIGREGRNIRALEAATGIDLIIDDTPEAVVISCFNPVRREIARLALTRLIADGRIHPSRIEEMVEKATEEVERQCAEAGEQAVFDLGIGRLHPELVKLVGKLKFRASNAQNLLQHSIEVGFLAGAMAGEIGLSVKTARRAGLLHDIGKAVDQEVEGSHAVVGAQVAKRHGEPAVVCHAIEAHHGDVAASDALAHVVDAANVLSGQRPGARREMLESYVQRLGDLEKIATSFAGVEKAFAIQAGREVRVLVENASVSDEEARALSRDIARRVESELAFPGQIRVAVVRETRATDYAK